MTATEWAKARARDLEMATLTLAAYLPVHRLRLLAVRCWGATLAPGVKLYHGFEIRKARRLEIGHRSSIGHRAILDARGGITIGADVNLSADVHIWSGQHQWDSPDFAYTEAPVVIGDRVWLSGRTTVLPGVTIGEGTVVASGAVVASDVPPNVLVGGIPARILGTRPPTDYRLPVHGKAWWW